MVWRDEVLWLWHPMDEALLLLLSPRLSGPCLESNLSPQNQG